MKKRLSIIKKAMIPGMDIDDYYLHGDIWMLRNKRRRLDKYSFRINKKNCQIDEFDEE